MCAPKNSSGGYRTRSELENIEAKELAPYACKSRESRGRDHPEEEHDYRTAFQRDRDRIIHTTAFRRLQYKTQVFVYYEGDYYRSRFAHTTEVAQIGRTIARALGVNEDLTEAIALAHDIGHPPFGHAGEMALNRAKKIEVLRVVERLLREVEDRGEMKFSDKVTPDPFEGVLNLVEKLRDEMDPGDIPAKQPKRHLEESTRLQQAIVTIEKLEDVLGQENTKDALRLEQRMEAEGIRFNHNEQSLKIVEEVEERYPNFPGLNLTWETREGIVKHETEYDQVSEVQARFGGDRQPSIEAQTINYADAFAYTTADLDDGLRAGILKWDDPGLANLSLWRSACEAVPSGEGGQNDLIRHRRIRFIFNLLVTKLIETSAEMIESVAPRSVEEVRTNPSPLVGLSEKIAESKKELNDYLLDTFYRSPSVEAMHLRAYRTIVDLMRAFCADMWLLPLEVQTRVKNVTHQPLSVTASPGSAPLISLNMVDIVTDYIAGMTDRYAQNQWGRLFDLAEPMKSAFH